jgi:hypothetical protein
MLPRTGIHWYESTNSSIDPITTSPAIRTTMTNALRVSAIAVKARQFMHPRWMEWRLSRNIAPVHPRPESTGMCRFASCLMLRILEREVPDGDWTIVGGSPYVHEDIDGVRGLPGGYLDPATGSWHGHYWLIDGNTGMVVDVTGDQFDGPSVWIGIDSVRYHENYCRQAIGTHLVEDMQVVEQWLFEWGLDAVDIFVAIELEAAA